ncbi:MAG TPA: GDSL-type esterase/lipase family protein, partial [Phycisphaerae bacterium]|nr:GDSL-type esterase/lipase family protein [Phycisphaerae bacterium]
MRWIAATALIGIVAAAALADGGIEVYSKIDFDKGDNPFINEGKGVVALESAPELVVSGRSLHIRRGSEGGYFGGRLKSVLVEGSTGVNIAFCLRTKGMETVALNFFDAIRQDNTTPASPAQVPAEQWRTVVFAVEDFHHNSDQPQKKIPARTKHTGLFFHGSEAAGQSGTMWIDKFIIYRGVDTQAPDAPGKLRAKKAEAGEVELAWDEPADNAFPAVYSIHRQAGDGGWVKIGESIQPRHVDRAPANGVASYRVTAADYDNNVSKPSKAVKIAGGPVSGAQGPPALTDQVRDRLAYADNVRKIHAAGQGKVRHDVFLFAGDSITAADAYTFAMGRWLARGITVRRGVGQMRTDFGKNNIDKYLEESKPEFAVVMYGTNDSKSPQAVEAAMANLSAVIDSCEKFGTVPILATIPPRGFDKDKQDGQAQFNAALVKL